MKEELLYIEDLNGQTMLVYPYKNSVINDKMHKVINDECILYISTLEGRRKAMSKYWGSNYNVPIYICEKICLLKIDSIKWINICNVENISNKKIIFKCGEILQFDINERIIKNKIRKLKDILKNIKN